MKMNRSCLRLVVLLGTGILLVPASQNWLRHRVDHLENLGSPRSAPHPLIEPPDSERSHPALQSKDLAASEAKPLAPAGFVMHQRVDEAPAWAVRYGEEFWRRPATEVSSKAGSAVRETSSVSVSSNK
jgi:hypothetical protein